MPQKIDYILDGLEIRASEQAMSLASGANPFAPRVSGGMTFRDFTIWNVWEQSNWQAGGMKPIHVENGFLYSSAETRYPNRITLQPLPTYVQVVSGEFGVNDYASFTEYVGDTWMGFGNVLYKWSTVSRQWEEQVSFPNPIKSIIEFAGIIFVAFGDAANVIGVDAVTLEQVVTDVRATILVLFNGLLYAAQGNLLQYTNYESPVVWDTINVGGPSETITGLAGMMNDVISSQIMYVSTQHKLYAVLAGDIVSDVSPWPGVSVMNGRSMLNHMGDIYAPSGEGMVRITKNGDLIPMGIDLGTGLPVEREGSIISIQSTLSFMHILVANATTNENLASSVWSWSGEGWHQIIQCESGKRAVGMFYSRALNRMFIMQNDGSSLNVFLPDESSVSRKGTNQRYRSSGLVDTCVYYGDLRNVEKMWGEVEVQGAFPAGTSVEVWYSTDETNPISKPTWSISDVNWSYLAAINSNRQVSMLPNIHGVAIRLRLVLRTESSLVTPTIEAVIVRYIPRIVRQWQWQLTISLPTDCLFYRDGSAVEGYSQELWDTRLREICTSLVPVEFVDIDGRTFQVVVTSFSRKIGNVGMESCENLIGDISWNLNILQVTGTVL